MRPPSSSELRDYHKMKDWAWSGTQLQLKAEWLSETCTELGVELRKHNPSMPVSVHLVASSAVRNASDVYRACREEADARSAYRWMIVNCVLSGKWP